MTAPRAPADLGHEGEADTFPVPVKKTAGHEPTIDQQAYGAGHGPLRRPGERADPPPGTAYKDLHDIAKVTQLLKSPAVAIVSDEDQEIADIVDYVVRIPVQDEVLFSVLAVLPGQLLPYWCGVGLGLNPDTQRSNVPKHARVWNMLFPPGTH